MGDSREDMRAKLSEYRIRSDALERMEDRRRRIHNQLDGAEELSKIEKEITLQKSSCAESSFELLRLLSYFPAGSRKHEILSLKYIDDLPWWKIGQQMYLSESACRKLEQQAIDELIQVELEEQSKRSGSGEQFIQALNIDFDDLFKEI